MQGCALRIRRRFRLEAVRAVGGSSGAFDGVLGRVVVGVGSRGWVGAVGGPSGPDSGALGGSFRPAPRSVGYTTAESCGNRRAHPGCRPERSSQSAISRLERSPRESSPRHRVARLPAQRVGLGAPSSPRHRVARRPLGQQPRQRGSSPRHRVARHLRVAKRGGSCAPGGSADRSGGRGARRGRRPCGARGGAGCPNLLQRPGSRRGAGGETLIFRASSRRRSRRGGGDGLVKVADLG